MDTRQKTLSQHLCVGLLLAFAGGFIDAYTYVVRGGVFAFAQTANMLLLAIHIVEGNFAVTLNYLCPIFAFAVGLFLCKVLSRYMPIRDRERILVLVLEIALLAVIASLPVTVDNLIVTSCVSLISALQFGSFRLLDGYPYATTMCTGNLRVMVESLYECVFDRSKAAGLKGLKYLAVLLCFIGGAVLSAYLATLLRTVTAAIAVVPVTAVLGILIVDEIYSAKRDKAKINSAAVEQTAAEDKNTEEGDKTK